MGRSLRSERSVPLLVLAVVGLIAAILFADIMTGRKAVLVGLLIVPALLAGITLPPRITRVIGAVCFLIAALAFLWNQHPESWTYWVPLTVVGAGAAAAYVVSVLRWRLSREAARMTVLADIGRVANGERSLHGTAQEIAKIVVPRFCDVCAVDVLAADGRLERIAVRLGRHPDLEQAMLERGANRDPGAAVMGALRGQKPVFVPAVDEETRRSWEIGDGDAQLLPQLGVTSTIVVPLRARGRPLGSLGLATAGGRTPFRAEDVEYAETLSGRVALALDNASLSAGLSSVEEQLSAILRTVDAAITVRSTTGQMVFTNQAAADLLKLPDPEAVINASPGELIERFEVYDEDGDPVSLAALPGTRILAGEASPAPIIVRNIVKDTGEERWLLNKATPVRDQDGEIVMAVNIIEDVTPTKRAELAQRILAEAGRALARADDMDHVLQVVAEMAVPSLADWAGVDLLEDGAIRTVAIAHRDPAMVEVGWNLRRRWPARLEDAGGIGGVLRTGEAELTSEIPDDLIVEAAQSPEHLVALLAIGLNSTMIVPILAGEEVIGALSFVSSTAKRFDGRDLALAQDLGREAGLALRNARLNQERAEIAHTLQASLLPEAIPDVPGCGVAAVYRPAGLVNEAGGDFYDFVRYGAGWAVLMGDVAGKGAVAAAITGLARHTLVTALQLTADPIHALGALNERLLARASVSLCTATIVLLPDTGGEVGVACGGHPLPLLRSGEAVHALGTPGTILGAVADPSLTLTMHAFAPGDVLLLYTDGVTDATGEGGRFGEERLHRLVASAPARAGELVASLTARLEDYIAEQQPDDIAVIAVDRR